MWRRREILSRITLPHKTDSVGLRIIFPLGLGWLRRFLQVWVLDLDNYKIEYPYKMPKFPRALSKIGDIA